VSAEPAPAPRKRRFYAVAHRAGNNLHHLEQALARGADAIECDLWHARGRLALRHERKLPALPVFIDKWYIRFAWGELALPRLLREIKHRADLFIDIKSATTKAADAVLMLHHDNESMMPHTLVSSRRWKQLDRIALAGTKMELYYSVGRGGGIDALLGRIDRAAPPAGVSLRHTLINRDVVARFHDAGMRILAWTVNTEHRAHTVLELGVDGIISDDLDVLNIDDDR
jgi:glycerophosphoryl diester phosphodiesterase